MKKIIFIALFTIYSNFIYSQLRIICTAALLNDDYESRKNEYIRCFEQLEKLGFKNPYIIESTKGSGATYLDDYSTNVYYSRAQDFGITDIRNKGINEARTLLDGLKHFNFDPDDMILKLTGRYFLKSDHIIKIIENNPDADAIVKVIHNGSWVLTGCYAMKYKHFIEMLENLDFNEMERNCTYIEVKVAQYLDTLKKRNKTSNSRVVYVDELHVTAKIIGEGHCVVHEL